MLNGFLTLTRCLNVALLHTTTEGGGGKGLSASIKAIYDGHRVHLGRGLGGGAKKRSEDGPRIEIQPSLKGGNAVGFCGKRMRPVEDLVSWDFRIDGLSSLAVGAGARSVNRFKKVRRKERPPE
jgi:hypothetical protein